MAAYVAQQEAGDDDLTFPESVLSFLFSARWAKIKAKMLAVAEGPVVSTAMTVLTLWSLFDDDIRMLATGPDADFGFMVIITIIFFVFWIDIFAACLYRNDYFQYPDIQKFSDPNPWVRISNFFTFGSFYFWTDILSTVSLISEVKKNIHLCSLLDILLDSFLFFSYRLIGLPIITRIARATRPWANS
jgi:hypothetical protein